MRGKRVAEIIGSGLMRASQMLDRIAGYALSYSTRSFKEGAPPIRIALSPVQIPALSSEQIDLTFTMTGWIRKVCLTVAPRDAEPRVSVIGVAVAGIPMILPDGRGPGAMAGAEIDLEGRLVLPGQTLHMTLRNDNVAPVHVSGYLYAAEINPFAVQRLLECAILAESARRGTYHPVVNLPTFES